MLAKGRSNFELRGLPDGFKFKDPSEMGEASLDLIIQHAESLSFVEACERSTDVVGMSKEVGGRSSDVGERSTDVGECSTDVGERSTNVGESSTDVGGMSTEVGGSSSDVGESSTDVGESSTDVGGRSINVVGRSTDVGESEDDDDDGCRGDVNENRTADDESEHIVENDERNEERLLAGGNEREGSGRGKENGDDQRIGGDEQNGGSVEDVRAQGSGERRKNKRKAKKDGKTSERKKAKGYEKCSAFCCHEPPVDEKTRRINWVQCDKCDKWFHWDCVGVLRKPSGKFNCGCDKPFSKGTPVMFEINCRDVRLRSPLKNRLLRIGNGTLASKRADLFKKIYSGRRKARDELNDLNAWCPFSRRQQERVIEQIKSICSELWPNFDFKTSLRSFSYITDVLLPEACILFIEREKKCRRNKAEEIFNLANGPQSDDESDD